MNIDTFWDLIRKSRRGAGQDCEQITENLVARLERLDLKEIISFEDHMGNVIEQAYRWDLWAVAYIINCGCSDDGFLYFRGWLISQGREFFDQVLANPETVARRVREGGEDVECEAIIHAGYDAYNNKTGQEFPEGEPSSVEILAEPVGKPWKEEDLEQLYPKLCKRFFN